MNSGERGMNPAAMTIIKPRKEYWPIWSFEPTTSCAQVFCASLLTRRQQFRFGRTRLIFSSTGRRPASLYHGLLFVVRPCVRSSVRPCVRPSVRALTFSLNIFFSETTYRISKKFHRNVPAMVLFRIF